MNSKLFMKVFYSFCLIFMANLNALVDLVFHPEIPYLDGEHIIVGGATALVTVLLFFFVQRIFSTSQQTLEDKVNERTAELSSVNQKLTREIEERKNIEAELQQSEEKYRSLVESTDDSIYVVNRACRYLFINKKHLSRMGLSKAQILWKEYGQFHASEKSKSFSREIEKIFRTGESLQREHRSERDNRHFLRTFSPLRGAEGEIVAVLVISKDITKLKKLEEDLRTLSLTDELTGLYNRRGFMTLVDQYIKISNRMKKEISILYADLDDLKEINDTYGHKEGDRALSDAAKILRETFRESDIIARIGGDEFVIIPIEGKKDNAEIIISRLVENIKTYNSTSGSPFRLSISTGTAYYSPESPASIEELLIDAERHMYEQKKAKSKE